MLFLGHESWHQQKCLEYLTAQQDRHQPSKAARQDQRHCIEEVDYYPDRDNPGNNIIRFDTSIIVKGKMVENIIY